jgi:hypothetical protein
MEWLRMVLVTDELKRAEIEELRAQIAALEHQQV